MARGDHPKPRHFYLNEAHELAERAPDLQARSPKFQPVDWTQRSGALSNSFELASAVPPGSLDPATASHRFLVARPASLTKVSDAKKARRTGGLLPFTPAFGGAQAAVLPKLGMELISVATDGAATVHVASRRLRQLKARIAHLPHAPVRERNRWINIDTFDPVEWSERVDPFWIAGLNPEEPVEVMLRFHAALPRAEIEQVLEALRSRILRSRDRLVRVSRDFSGRYWCLAVLTPPGIAAAAKGFPSLHAIHPPLASSLAGSRRRRRRRPRLAQRSTALVVDPATLPTVGMLDAGIPGGHDELSPFIRGTYVDPSLQHELAAVGDHGSHVASALVFGDVVKDDESPHSVAAVPGCRVFDMLGSWTRNDAGDVPDELMVRAVDGVLAIAPDVRVFNMSLFGPRLDLLGKVDRDEKLRHLQHLDNLAFARDILLVLAAGNSPYGLVPEPSYPKHIDNESWQLGVLATAFNAMVVGSHVDRLSERGIVTEAKAPSPFTRIGPGRLNAPVPSFSAPGGDGRDDYTFAFGSGVWCLNASGQWEDVAGTSLAAPLVARECAFAFRHLEQYCPDGPPYAATVRAWMTVVGHRPSFVGDLEKLARRTLGRGFPAYRRIRAADPGSAIFVWQTTLGAAGVVARVTIPVPTGWLATATAPRVRVVVAALTPVSAALVDTWACRKVSSQLKVSGAEGVRALRGGRGTRGAYPVSDRTYDISPAALNKQKVDPEDGGWCLQVSYRELGPPPAGMEFTEQQRVGVVVELRDDDDAPISPQPFVQALEIAPMTRLSVTQVAQQVPVKIRT